MDTVEDLIAFNKRFVDAGAYQPFVAEKYPRKRLAIVTCMDTRLTTLLPAALGLENGDAVIIKDAGAQVSNPFGTVIRSLLVAVLELHVQHIMVVGHTNCGAQNMNAAQMCAAMVDAGVSRQNIDLMRYCGVDFDRWLAGFETSEAEVRHTVLEVRDNPLIPAAVDVRGFVIDSHTGALAEVDCA